MILEPKMLNEVPKQFADAAIAGHSKETFIFVLGSGTQLTGFATSPMQMKSISDMFVKSIAQYEEKFGKIPTIAGTIPSPIQLE